MRDRVTPALPVSDRDLERVLAGEAPPALVAHVEGLAKVHPALAAHLAERRAERAAFALSHPRLPTHAPGAAPGAAHASTWMARLFRTPIVSGALAAACVLFFVVGETGPRAPTVRDKGAAASSRVIKDRVTLTAKRGARVFHPGPGALLRAGDALKVEVTCGAPSFVVLAIVEGDTRKASVLVEGERVPAERTALEGSFVLDEHVGDEALVVACAPSQALARHYATELEMGRRPAGAALVPIRKEP